LKSLQVLFFSLFLSLLIVVGTGQLAWCDPNKDSSNDNQKVGHELNSFTGFYNLEPISEKSQQCPHQVFMEKFKSYDDWTLRLSFSYFLNNSLAVTPDIFKSAIYFNKINRPARSSITTKYLSSNELLIMEYINWDLLIEKEMVLIKNSLVKENTVIKKHSLLSWGLNIELDGKIMATFEYRVFHYMSLPWQEPETITCHYEKL